MHFGFICDELPPEPHGGVGSFTADLAQGLVASGHRATIFIAEMVNRHWSLKENPDPGANPKIVPIYLSNPGWMRWRPGYLWRRWKLLQRIKAEHARTPFDLLESMDNIGMLPFGGIPGVPTVVRLHGATFFFDTTLGLHTSDTFTHTMERQTIRKASYLVSVSNYIGEAEPAAAGLKRRADRTIYNSVNTNYFAPDATVPTEKGLIVFANKIHPLKGVFPLCRAMNLVCKTHPDARLMMVGRDSTVGKSGRLLRDELIDELEPAVRQRVMFTGVKERSEVRDFLRRAQVCCYPSKLESFGIAPIEAMSVGKPTIFCRTGAGPEIIEEGVTGLLCDPESPEDIAARICRILNDETLAEEMGRRARQRIIEQFDRANWVSRNFDFYKEAIAAFKAGGQRSLHR